MTDTTTKGADSKAPTLQSMAWTIASLWFGGSIQDRASCEAQFDLQPHAALVLLTMATQGAACAQEMQSHLTPIFGGPFDRQEAHILFEYGLWSLFDNGYLELDKQGEEERAAHDHGTYGLGYIRWHITSKAAKLIAPAYCAIKGLPSDQQEQAANDILAANKEAVKKSRANSAALGFA